MANQLYVIQNAKTGMLARHDSEGERDGKVTDDMCAAKEFWSKDGGRAAASEYSQNFGPDWNVQAVFDEPGSADISRAIAHERAEGRFPHE